MQLWNNKRSNGLQLLITNSQLCNLIVYWLKHYVIEVAKQFINVALASDLCSCYTVQRIAKMTICCSISKHNLVRYVFIYQLYRKESFGQENFGESFAIRQIRKFLLPPKFCIVQYYVGIPQCFEICSYFVKLVSYKVT